MEPVDEIGEGSGSNREPFTRVAHTSNLITVLRRYLGSQDQAT